MTTFTSSKKLRKNRNPASGIGMRGSHSLQCHSAADATFLPFPTDQRYGPGAMWPSLLPERAQNHKRPFTGCNMQFEYNTANPQEGRITMFVLFIM